ncbi:putative delta(14)-sterol reductase isoform X2 [Apostichopus japonicus]|uniref:Delta(14)-sterol reductase LBR n=1 Tax=Stichopus japonicus TaxID=307972 RepID=A0A2G8LME2_STIJA|nr:putative delta(14)-sterol reductase isoform X2 [Apostichopus japonicus]
MEATGAPAWNMKGFNVGEQVRAKWPGSRLWYKATILEELSDGFKVKFEDGTEDELDFNDVAIEISFKVTEQEAEPLAVAVASEVAGENHTEEDTGTTVTQTRTQTKSTEEHRTYTTRSATRSGQQTLEPPTDIHQRSTVPKTKYYEFGGPIGVVLMMFLLPLVVYYLYFACNKGKCQFDLYPTCEGDWKKYFDVEAFLLVIGWIVFQVLIYFIPVGRIVQGLPLRSGKRLKYYVNAFYALVLSLVFFGLLVYYEMPFDVVIKKYLAVITTCMVLSIVMSIALYIKAKRAPSSELAPSGNSGNFFYDFFMGHELNPRIGMLDLKYFCELRPGMIGWIIIDHIFLFSAWKDFPQNPPLPLLLLTIFHTLYVADALWFEAAILSTMDIITEGFGSCWPLAI